MTEYSLPPDVARKWLKPLRDVRTARQKPAHALRTNVTDKTFVHKQVELLDRINTSLSSIRKWLATHPDNKGHKLRYDEIALGVRYRM